MAPAPGGTDAVVASAHTALYIDGTWRAAADGRVFAVEDPATGQTIASVADAGVSDARDAMAAAADAFDAWRSTSARERSDVLRRAHELIAERTDELALLMTLEMGKPLAESRGEVSYANDFLRWYGEEAVRVGGRFGTNDAGTGRILTMRQPVGPCLFITPWNFPLAMGTRKIAPALAVGCTCVVKPAEQTPLSMLALAGIFDEAGLPPGVLNVVTTSSSAAVMAPLIADPRLRKLSFTGSTAVGQRLIAQSAEQVLRTSMELGGNAPFLVFADADLDAAVDGAVVAKMRNGGEACTSANRFIVHASVADEFAARLADRMAAMRVGHGTEPGVQVGPLIDEGQRAKVAELVADALDKGARALCGGHPIDGAGHFYRPTVLVDVPSDALVLREEIFGPVAPVVRFDDDDEAIRLANDTEHGLVAYVYTRDIGRAFRAIERLETGMVGLNQGVVSNAGAPFGGIKHSGTGREGGPEGLDEYLETKYVAVNVAPRSEPARTRP